MRFIRILILLAMLGLAGGIAAGFLGFVHPAFDTFSNFRLHFSVILLVLAALWSFRCSRAPSLVFALIGFGGLFACAPGLPLTSYANLPSGGERVYRAFVMNLWWRNEDPTQVAKEIAKHDPDILYLVEASRTWVSTITELQRTYPYIFQCPNWRNISGNVILSRMPINDNQDQCDSKAALGLTKVIIDGKRVTAGVAHLRWPWPFSGSVQIDRIEPKLKSIGDNALIAANLWQS